MSDESLSRTMSISATFNYVLIDAEKVLSAFGKYGRYQMLTYLITTSVGMLYALNMMIMPFITKSTRFSCNLPDGPSDNRYSAQVGDSCLAFDSYLNTSVQCSSVKGSFYEYTDGKQSTITSEFNLVCEDDGSAEHSISIFLLGGMVISPFITLLADWFGRRLLFLIPLLVSVVANLTCVFTKNYYQFLLLRFVSGVATTSFSMTASVLCLESVALEFRSLTPVVSAISWVTGYMLAGLFSIYIKDWRYLYLAASVPGLLTFPFIWVTPESLHWLVTKRKHKKIEKYINASIAFNRQPISLIDCKSDNESVEIGARRSFRDLFHPKIFVNLLINSYVMIVMSGTYWALSLYSTELSEDETTGYFLSGFVELPAGILAAIFLVLFKRKTVSFFSLVFTSVFMMCTVWLPMQGSWKMVFPLMAKVTNSIVWASQPLLYSESTPTTIRNMYTGIVGLLGELGSVGAPYMNRLTAINKDAPAVVICLLSFIAACVVLLQPETKNKKLPEDIDDFDGGPLFRGCRTKKNKKAAALKSVIDIESAEKPEKPEEAVELLEMKKDDEVKESERLEE